MEYSNHMSIFNWIKTKDYSHNPQNICQSYNSHLSHHDIKRFEFAYLSFPFLTSQQLHNTFVYKSCLYHYLFGTTNHPINWPEEKMGSCKIHTLGALASLLFVLPVVVHGWGVDGHLTICKIAQVLSRSLTCVCWML